MATENVIALDLTLPQALTDEQLRHFEEHGYVRLGKVASDEEVAALCGRIDDIMMGNIKYDNMLMQLCPSHTKDTRSDGASAQTKSFKGATLKYRKIQDLEQDPVFRQRIQSPLFRDITRKLIGENVSIFRSMFFNKPAGGGVKLNWHHDGASWDEPGSGWAMTHAPKVTIWTALDPATKANGCMQIIPGSHKKRATLTGDFLTPEQIEEHCPEEKRIFMELEPGETVVLHNFVLHMSEPNSTDKPRRALSICYIDAASRQVPTGASYAQIFPEYVPAENKASVTVSY